MKLKHLLLFSLISTYQISSSQTYQSHNVSLLSHWDNPNQASIAWLRYQKYNGCWGWTDTIKQREYALVGSTTGTYFVDVTNPYNPIECAFLAGCNDTVPKIHREIKSYSHYAYISCDDCSEKTFQIIDLQYLPDSIHLISDTSKYYSHTLYIDEPNAKLYLTNVTAQLPGQIYKSDLHVYDLSTPEAPVLLRSIEMDYPNLLGYTSHDCFARNDTIYLSAANNGYYIFKQSGNTAFSLLGSLTNYPNSGYNHSSWLTDDSRYAVLCEEESKNVIKILDLQDPSNINIVGHCISRPDTSAIHHNPFVIGNNRVAVACYSDGIQIFDFSDPSNPLKTGYFDTFYQNDNDTVINLYDFRGAWGTYPYLKSKHLLVLDMQNGLYIMDASAALKVEELKNTTNIVKVHPNPAADYFNITGINSKTKIKLYDIFGQIILERETVNNTIINTCQFKRGVYTLVTENLNFRDVNKVILSR